MHHRYTDSLRSIPVVLGRRAERQLGLAVRRMIDMGTEQVILKLLITNALLALLN